MMATPQSREYRGPGRSRRRKTEEARRRRRSQAPRHAGRDSPLAGDDRVLAGRVIQDANANFLAALGHTLEEIKGQHHSIFVDPLHRQSPEYRSFWDRLARGEPETGLYKLIGKAGKEVWLQAAYTVALDGQDKPTRILAVGMDVSLATQKAVAEAEELKIRTDIMDTTSIVSYADLKGDIVSVNNKFIEVSKYPRDELIGKPHNTTRHPDMPKEVFKELWSTIGRGKPFRGIIKNRAKDGTPYYVDAVIAPIMGNNGKPKGYLGVRYDITETEIERHNMRGLFAAINENYAYIEFDPSGVVITANPIFLNLLGYQLAEVVGKHHRTFVDPAQSASSSYLQFWTDLNAGKAFSEVFKRITKMGTEVWIQAVYSPVRDEVGRVVKIVKIATDVTAARVSGADFEGQIAAIGKAQAVIEFALDGKVLDRQREFPARRSATRWPRSRASTIQHVRRSGVPPERRTIGCSGTSSAAANTMPASTSGSARAARKSGSRPATTRSWT